MPWMLEAACAGDTHTNESDELGMRWIEEVDTMRPAWSQAADLAANASSEPPAEV